MSSSGQFFSWVGFLGGDDPRILISSFSARRPGAALKPPCVFGVFPDAHKSAGTAAFVRRGFSNIFVLMSRWVKNFAGFLLEPPVRAARVVAAHVTHPARRFPPKQRRI